MSAADKPSDEGWSQRAAPLRRTTLNLFGTEGQAPGSRSTAPPTEPMLDAAVGGDGSPLWQATFAEEDDVAPPAAFAVDAAGHVRVWNETARALVRWPGDEDVAGRHMAELGLFVTDHEAWQTKLMARLVPVPATGRLVLPGRLPRVVAVSGLYMPDKQLTVMWIEAPDPGTRAIRVDDMAASDLLRALDAAAQAARIGVAINTKGPEGDRRIAYVNEAGALMLGRPRHQLIASAVFPPEGVVLSENGPTTVPWAVPGGDRLLELGVSSGQFHGLDAQFVVFADVTDGQPHEEERKRLVQELFNANVDLRNFARATTHDLRAPLRSIAGFAALLERRIRGRLGDDEVRLINNVIASTRRMDQLIEALAAFSAIGARPIENAQVELNTVLGDVLSDLASELEQQDIHLEFTSLPSIHGDAILLRQLFQNLLGNAIKFRHKQPHRVRIEAEQDGEWVVLRFVDNGVGIDLTRANDLFQPFRRFHDLAKFPGSGLGLATCKRIVEVHGGSIEVASEPGAGATFTVRLPN